MSYALHTKSGLVKSSLTALVLGWACVGCGSSSEYVELRAPPGPMASRAPRDVEVFTTAPSRAYTEVGIVEARQSSGYSTDDMPEIIAELRRAAAKRGCDGVILTGSADAVTGNAEAVVTLRGYRGTCIVFASRPGRSSGSRGSQVKRRHHSAGYTILETGTVGSGLSVHVAAAPQRAPEEVSLRVGVKMKPVSATRVPEPAHAHCELNVVIGEERTTLSTTPSVDGLWESLTGKTDIALVERMAASEAVRVEACDTSIKLSASTRQRFRVFVDECRKLAAEALEPAPDDTVEL